MRFLRWLNPCVWWRKHLRAMDHRIVFPLYARKAQKDKRRLARALNWHLNRDHAWRVEPWQLNQQDLTLILFVSEYLGDQRQNAESRFKS